ncbi:phosphotransferase [Halalkalicoccus subterraneus]|uniref:phosphotransferase n=1 Tax=Halalkalicoccus subterraneus TaxID=2675002 RepID=UPI000EFAE5F0|nr:phosphotransferase [Halalkalicoccus subterraneus]
MGSAIETANPQSFDRPGVFDRIAEFYEYQGIPSATEVYMVLDTDGYNTYAFRPESRAIEWLVDRLGGGGWKSRLGTTILETTAAVPGLLPFVPLIRSEYATVAAENPFDVAVVGDRITLLQLDNRHVSTIAIDDPDKLRNEIEHRQRLPDSINTPPIIEHDSEYPYIIERYLNGRELIDPVEEWKALFDALNQLTALYENDRHRVATTDVVRELEGALATEDETNGTTRAGLQLLDDLDLPSSLYRGPIHGDLHARNLFINDAVYILDWEDVRMDYLLDDLFRPFVIHQYDIPLHQLFVQMIHGRGEGGRIMADYAREIGPIAYGDSETYSGLPLFYLLSLLADGGENGSLRPPCRELLSGIVSSY